MTGNPFLTGDAPPDSFEARYRRVYEAAECRTQIELAALLGIGQSSISDAKRRRSVPAEWLITLMEKKGVSPEWLRSGTGGKMLQTTDLVDEAPRAVINVMQYRPAAECTTDELLAELARRVLKIV